MDVPPAACNITGFAIRFLLLFIGIRYDIVYDIFFSFQPARIYSLSRASVIEILISVLRMPDVGLTTATSVILSVMTPRILHLSS